MKSGKKLNKASSTALLLLITIALITSSTSLTELVSYPTLTAADSLIAHADPDNATLLLWERDGGIWCDAEKQPPSDGAGNTNPGDARYEDDLMC